jgi:hydroxyacylglutathione hydrolase
VLDTRHQREVVKGFIPGSIFIGVDGDFAPWVGALITDLKQPILFVAEPGREQEVVDRLARVGYDNPIGFLEGGFEAWKSAGEEIDTMEEMTPEALAKAFDGQNLHVLDVRKISEFDQEHLVGARSFPLDFINRNMQELKPENRYILYCGSGYRSVIAGSILKTRGVDQVVNVPGGFKALRETGVALSEYVPQTTEL